MSFDVFVVCYVGVFHAWLKDFHVLWMNFHKNIFLIVKLSIVTPWSYNVTAVPPPLIRDWSSQPSPPRPQLVDGLPCPSITFPARPPCHHPTEEERWESCYLPNTCERHSIYLSPSKIKFLMCNHQISLVSRQELSLRFTNLAIPNIYIRRHIPHPSIIDPFSTPLLSTTCPPPIPLHDRPPGNWSCLSSSSGTSIFSSTTPR